MRRGLFTLIAVAVLAMLSATASLAAMVQTTAAGLVVAVGPRTGSVEVAVLPSTSTLASYDLNAVLVVIIALALTATLAVVLVTRRT